MAPSLTMRSKSQLAIEYGYRIKEQCPDTWVFWVFAGSPARFEEDFRKIATDVQIPGRDNPQADIFTLVCNWLRNPTNGRWLIIIDNADDAQIFPNSEVDSPKSQESGQRRHSRPLSCFLPQTDNGRILMTTRYRDIALKFVEGQDIIPVDPMNESDALELLEQKIQGLPDRDSDSTRKKLVAELEYMPLAIAQAAAYIVHSALSRPIQGYLERFRESDSKRRKLLEREGGHLRRDWEAKNSVLITWQISFDHLRQVRQSAADRLSLMSFFDRQGIPKDLVREQTHAKETLSSRADDVNPQGESVSHSASDSSDDDDFEDDMLTLRNYSFVTFNGEESYEMHALVQLATKRWLANEDNLDAFRWQFFEILVRAFKTLDKGEFNPKGFHILYPHAKAALSQRSEAEASSNGAQALRDFATAMLHAGKYAKLVTSNFNDTKRLFKAAMEVQIKILGTNNMDTMTTMNELAMIYSRQGKSHKAKNLILEVVAKSQSEFGLKHMSTLEHMICLATIHLKEGCLKQAEEILIQVLDAMRDMSVPISRTLDPLESLAEVYSKQGKLDKAFGLHELVVSISKEKLGLANKSTLGYMREMAEMMPGLGRLDEAIDLQMQVVEEIERMSDAQHMDILIHRFSLYRLFLDKGLVEKGLENMMQLLREAIKIYGQKFSLTTMIMMQISLACGQVGRLDQAEGMGSRLFELYKEVGADDQATIPVMYLLVSIRVSQHRFDEAKEILLQILEKRKKLFGPDHPRIAETMEFLVKINTHIESQNEPEDLD